jgi:hypothetical protein
VQDDTACDRTPRASQAAVALPTVMTRLPTLCGQDEWRTFDLRVRGDLTGAAAHTWLPLPLPRATPYQRVISQGWSAHAQTIGPLTDDQSKAAMSGAVWTTAEPKPTLTLSLRVATRDYRVALEPSKRQGAFRYQIFASEVA